MPPFDLTVRSAASQEDRDFRRQRPRSNSETSSRTLGREDEELDNLFGDEVIDLTIDGLNTSQNSLYHHTELPLASFRTSVGLVQLGDCLEVKDFTLARHLVNFIQVKAIARSPDQVVKVRGVPLTRTRNLVGKLPRKCNEVCMILHFSRRDNQNQQSLPLMVDVTPHAILRKRRLVFTNTIYPEYCSETTRFRKNDKTIDLEKMQDFGELVCRWKLSVYFSVTGRKTRPEEEALERIHWAEVDDEKYRQVDEILCNRWRGGRDRGGSWDPVTARSSASIDLDGLSSTGTPASPTTRRQYTLFDSFSGAGGVSRGAQCAGFKVAFAIDKAADVWDTYQANFPNTKLYRMSVDAFIRQTKGLQIRVDILHLSPPCQYFSPAHTRQGAQDDTNIFALFGCCELINKTRPRIITLEQTFGITHDRHLIYFRALIGDLTQFGYSVRWKVVRLWTWGCPQTRKRLIIIAAAPGEKLPPFPKDTHSECGEDGLKPFNTIREAIRRIEPDDDLHDLENVKYHRPRRPEYSQDQLSPTIVASSNDTYFPDGTRDYTLREIASLQGFPKYHRFKGNKTSITKQIGNAFPPITVKVLYEHLKNWLMNEDGIAPWKPRQNIVIIDDPTDSPVTAASSILSTPLPSVARSTAALQGRPTVDEELIMSGIIDLT